MNFRGGLKVSRYIQGAWINGEEFGQCLVLQELEWHLLSGGNVELSPRLSKFLSNIRTFEDYMNHWGLKPCENPTLCVLSALQCCVLRPHKDHR